jgi:hypothetical protein
MMATKPAQTQVSPEATSIEDRFALALEQLVDMCIDAGMAPKDCIGPLKKHLLWARQSEWGRDYDDKYNADRGLAPRTEAQIREALELEPGEPLPPRGDW